MSVQNRIDPRTVDRWFGNTIDEFRSKRLRNWRKFLADPKSRYDGYFTRAGNLVVYVKGRYHELSLPGAEVIAENLAISGESIADYLEAH